MTTYSLSWLPDVLEAAGLKVAEVPGWRTRGRAEMGTVKGIICHHTGTTREGNMPTLKMLIDGRPDLNGPLCQLGLGRDGTFYVVAAGRANHAGIGRWEGITTGNSNFIGIEAENGGRPQDLWPDEQMDAYIRGVAAILKHVGAGANMCCGHKEYAPGRKVDPTFDMAVFRSKVSDYLVGKTPPPPIPAADPKNRPTMRRGMRGPFVEELQRAIGVGPDGIFGGDTEAAVRARQRALNLVPDGIVGPKTWAVISGEAPPPEPPAHVVEAVKAAAEAAATAPALTPTAAARKVGPAGIALIQFYEQCEDAIPGGKYAAYPDPGSADKKPWTIGWGSTGNDVTEGTVWTKQQCDDRFAQDMESYAAAVSRAIGNAPTTQNQFDALVSFHYNTGAIATATLTKLHKAGDYAGAKGQFALWNKNNHKVMLGLTRRRAKEAELYGKP